MEEKIETKLPRGQAGLRVRLLKALQQGAKGPHLMGKSSQSVVYRLRDGKPIQKPSATRLDEALTRWETEHNFGPHVKTELHASFPLRHIPTEDPELEIMRQLLTLPHEAQIRITTYFQSKLGL